MKWFAVLFSAGCLIPLAFLVDGHLATVGERVADLEAAHQKREQFLQSNQEELARLQAELLSIEAELAAGATAELAERLQTAEEQLFDLGATLVLHDEQLTLLDHSREQFGPAVLEARLRLHDQHQEERWADVSAMAQTAAELADRSLAQLEVISAAEDARSLWEAVVGPVVQLAGKTSVGSGVLLRSEPSEAPSVYETYVLTAWHVVRDIQGDLDHTDMPVPVSIYDCDGRVQEETATLLVFNPALDVALLSLDRDAPVEFGTFLAERERVEDIYTFDPIIAVGCPLGNDPIPTRGEIASPHHEVDGEVYWMINAPTYIGNSGGPIFDAETHALLGIFSKIYTHGSLRPTVVPHMGLVTPLDGVYEWLSEVGYGHLEPGVDGVDGPAPRSPLAQH